MIDRRRFLTIIAGLGLALGQPAAAGHAQFHRWRGTALGAAAQVILPRDNARELVALALGELSRLEDIFSLYRRDSALSRLNATGLLSDPPAELLALLDLCGSVHRMTGGAFDPTIQPLWRLYAESYAAGRAPAEAEIEKTKRSTGWNLIHYSTREVGFEATGCALSLNGIAQGYIADQIARLLRAEGLKDVLVDMGEIVALGRHADGGPWPITIQGTSGCSTLPPSPPGINRAVATSAPHGTTFDAAGTVGHILDPRTGRPADTTQSVTVTGPSAAFADGLSTGLCIGTDHPSHTIPDGYAVIRS